MTCPRQRAYILFLIGFVCVASCFAVISDRSDGVDSMSLDAAPEKLDGVTSDVMTSQKEPTQPISCFSCTSQEMGELCMNGSLTQQEPALKRQCSDEQQFCLVRVYKSAISINASTTKTRVWSLERGCVDKCHPNCLMVGERTKIISCVSCCSEDFCNFGNGSSDVVLYRWLMRVAVVLSLAVRWSGSS